VKLQSRLSATARLLAAAAAAAAADDYDASCEPNSRRHHRLNFVLLSGSVRPDRLDARRSRSARGSRLT
jgi:hypothetical protein